MFAEKRSVIVVAVVLVVCGLLFCNANAVVEARSSSALTISAPSSAKVNQPFTLSGTLTANGAALTKQTVSLQRLSGTTWTTLASQTATIGTYSFSRTETTATTYQYRTVYAGAAPYASSISPTVTVTVAPATISSALNISAPSSAKVNQPFTLSGTLTANGAALTKQTVSLQRLSGTTWTTLASQTATIGTYSFSRTETTATTYQYRTVYAGAAPYASSISPTVTVTVTAVDPSPTPTPTLTPTPTPTTITITASTTNPAVSQPFTLSGTLTANGTPLSGKTIVLCRTDPAGAYSQPNSTTTNANGAYTFTLSESAKGIYYYAAAFPGDTYAKSNAAVKITVGTLTPTTITITASTTNPAVSQPFTLSGTLTANGTPLSGKTIVLCRTDPAGAYSQPNSTTTNANGAYTFTLSESVQGTYYYAAAFPGDTYAASNAAVRLGVGDLQTSALSVVATNDAPAVSQSFTLHGFLQNGVSGAPLAGQSINLSVRCPSGQSVNMETTTDTNGAYAFTRSESAQGTYVYQLSFGGNSSYYPSSAPLELNVGNPIPTTLSLNITDSAPSVNQSFTISGYLTDINGTALSHRALLVDTRLPTGDWATVPGETITDSNGYYSVTTSEQAAGQYRFELHFMGDNTYALSGNWALVAVGALQPTKISANTSVTNPGVGESHTLFGNLTDANGKPLSGKEIDLYQYAAGQINPPDIFQTGYTDQNGHYFFVLNENTSGKYTYTARFCGDQIYAYSQASVSLTVGTLTPTTITITASTTNPAVSQPFTLSGTLTANGTPLSGKTIVLCRTDPAGAYSQPNSTTTNANGAYTFTLSESVQGTYYYAAAFPGDTYAASNAAVKITVGTLTPTTITITTSNANPTTSQPFTLSGTLTANGTPLSGKTIVLCRTDPSGAYSQPNSTTTNANGAYTFTLSESAQGIYYYAAAFPGDTYAASNAAVKITVGN